MNTMLMDNEDLITVINSFESEESSIDYIIDIFKMLSDQDSQIVLYENNTIDKMYDDLYRLRKNEDVELLSRLIEKLIDFKSELEHQEEITQIENLNKAEGENIKEVLSGKEFNFDVRHMVYKKSNKENVRNIHTYEDLIDILCIFSNNYKKPEKFIAYLKTVFKNIKFDEDIVNSIFELNDGFDDRQLEIIYHLNCIEKQIPEILSREVSDYASIGRELQIDCSPERSRDKVNSLLTKNIEGKKINCELHTKMKRLSSKAPDRIYFCPRVPDHFSEELRNLIYIYKITKHV